MNGIIKLTMAFDIIQYFLTLLNDADRSVKLINFTEWIFEELIKYNAF